MAVHGKRHAHVRPVAVEGRNVELISQREYARRRGVSHAAVQRAVRSGRISTVRGKIDPERADQEWNDNTDQSKPRNRITGKPKQKRNPGTPAEPMDMTGPETNGNVPASGYAKARAVREAYQAQLSKLELETKRGELVRADDVKLAAFNMAKKTRDQLIALPERVAALLAATTDAGEVQRILEEEVEMICLEISDAEHS